MNPLVSIIIPAYNRAQLVVETLVSILDQTYKNWECIVVDDGSLDHSLKVIKEYTLRDSRIKIFERPGSLIKGANSCRNFGFQKSLGDYIIWFDSDDLMTPDHIEKKVEAIEKQELDFIVAKTQNFKNGKMLEPYVYEKKSYGIKASDFILLKIHWYTYDVLLKREIAEQISWNEKMKSWQDYNYFCKMLLTTENGDYLDEVLTHRRLHAISIQSTLTSSPKFFSIELLENRLLTFIDIEKQIDPHTRKELIFGMMNLCFDITCLKKRSQYTKNVMKIVSKHLGSKSKIFFNLSIFLGGIVGRGHYFLNKAKQR